MASILERNKNMKPKKKSREEYAEDALYREVWEEVNNEKIHAFVKKYYRHLIAGALGILIIATAIQIGIRVHHNNKTAVATNYEAAVASVDANALAALSEDTSGATADLALFQAYLIDNDIKKLEKLAQDGHTHDFKDLARIHIIGIKGDDMTPQQVEDYLEPLNTKKSPFYYTSRLTIAQKYISVGDRENANKWLDKIINDDSAPAVISASAQSLR